MNRKGVVEWKAGSFIDKPTKCSTCGKDISSDVLMRLVVRTEDKEAMQENFGPYEVSSYAWCAECVLRAMGTPIKDKVK